MMMYDVGPALRQGHCAGTFWSLIDEGPQFLPPLQLQLLQLQPLHFNHCNFDYCNFNHCNFNHCVFGSMYWYVLQYCSLDTFVIHGIVCRACHQPTFFLKVDSWARQTWYSSSTEDTKKKISRCYSTNTPYRHRWLCSVYPMLMPAMYRAVNSFKCGFDQYFYRPT